MAINLTWLTGPDTGAASFQLPREIDALTGASYQFYSGQAPIPVHTFVKAFMIKTIKAEGISSPCLISVGNNSPNYDNILPVYSIRPIVGAVEIIKVDHDPLLLRDVVTPYDPNVLSPFLKISTPGSGTAFTFFFGFDIEDYKEGLLAKEANQWLS
jgi:hypothetical protein